MEWYQLNNLVQEKINQKHKTIILSAFKQFIIKHTYNKNCDCELCVSNDKILNLKINAHALNRKINNYYKWLPLSTLNDKYTELYLIQENLNREKFIKELTKNQILNKIK